jgi:hypothetical protein
VLDLEHYLDVLERKPGALIGSKPLAAWRQRGLWPESYDRLLAQLIERHGQPSGTRQMVQVLSLTRPHSHARVRAAVEEAIALGCADAAAVRHLVEAADLGHARNALIELGELARFERPASDDRLRWLARPGGGAMNAEAAALEAATIRQQCKVLRMPTIAAQCAQLAEQAVRERRTHLSYLEALLQAELEERDQRLIERRIREARLPPMKSLEEFDWRCHLHHARRCRFSVVWLRWR